MASILDIYNLALIHLGENTKTSSTDIDNIPNIYEETVKELLTKNSFSFSYREDELLKKANSVNKYHLPADFLYLVKSNLKGKVIEDEFILLDTDYEKRTIVIKYIKRVSERYFPSYFVELLALSLARKVSLSYNIRQEVLSLLNEKYYNALSTAENADQSDDDESFGRRLFW